MTADRFTDVFDIAPVAIIALDLKNVIRAWNQAAARLFRFSASEAIGRTTEELDIAPRSVCEAALSATTPAHTCDAQCRRRDGTRFIAELSFVWINGHNQHPVGTQVYVRDVTKHRMADARLEQAEARYRRVVEGAEQFALFSTDPQGQIDTWNSGAERVLGYRDAEVLGKNIAIIFNEHDRRAGISEKELEQAAKDGIARDERWHVRKDGSLFWASGVLAALREDDRRLTGFVKAMRDDTRRKLAEERLEEEKERLATILESLLQGVIVTDPAGRITLMNRRAEEMTGWTRDEADGLPLTQVFPIGEVHGKDPIEAVKDNGRRERGFHRIELKDKRAATHQIAFMDVPMRKGSEFLGAVFVFRDIAEELRMEESLVKAEKLSAWCIERRHRSPVQ